MDPDFHLELVLNELNTHLKDINKLIATYYENKDTNKISNAYIPEDLKEKKASMKECWKLIKDDLRTIDFYKNDYANQDKNIKEAYSKIEEVDKDLLFSASPELQDSSNQDNELFDYENQNNKLVMAVAQMNDAKAHGIEGAEELHRQAQRQTGTKSRIKDMDRDLSHADNLQSSMKSKIRQNARVFKFAFWLCLIIIGAQMFLRYFVR